MVITCEFEGIVSISDSMNKTNEIKQMDIFFLLFFSFSLSSPPRDSQLGQFSRSDCRPLLDKRKLTNEVTLPAPPDQTWMSMQWRSSGEKEDGGQRGLG